MRQSLNSLSNNNPHCLRSKKLNDEQMLLLRQFEGNQKSNKTAYKFLKETINNMNNMTQKNTPVNKLKNNRSNAYSPLPLFKRSKSYKNKSSNNNAKNLGQNRKNKDNYNQNNKKEAILNKNIKKEQSCRNNFKRHLKTTNRKNCEYEHNNHKKIKDIKRNGIKGKQKYTYVKNGIDDYNNKDSNNFVLCINKTKEIQKLLIKHKKNIENNSAIDSASKDENNDLYKSTEVTNNNDTNENEIESLSSMKNIGIYSEEIYNNIFPNNNMLIEEEIDIENNIIVIRKNSVIKKLLKNFKKKSYREKKLRLKNKSNFDNDEEMINGKKEKINKEIKTLPKKIFAEEIQKKNNEHKLKKFECQKATNQKYKNENINKNIINDKNNNNNIIKKDDSKKREGVIIKKGIFKPVLGHIIKNKRAIFALCRNTNFGILNENIKNESNINKETCINEKELLSDNKNNNCNKFCLNIKEKSNNDNNIKDSKQIIQNISPIKNEKGFLNNNIDNNLPFNIIEFRFDFNANNSKKKKKNFISKIEEISEKEYLGHKSQRTGSEVQMKIPKKRGRKKKKINENKVESCDIEVSGAISELKKNLKKTEEDCQFLLDKSRKSSLEKIKDVKKIFTEDISSQNTSKDQNKQHSLSSANLINDNNINNICKKYKNYNNIKKRKYRHKIENVFIRIREEEDDEDEDEDNNNESNNNYKNNGDLNEAEENIEIFSLSSTPEIKKKLRNNINLYQNLYSKEENKKRFYKKRKYNKHSKSNFINYNVDNYQSDSSNIKNFRKKREEFLEIDVSGNKFISNHKKNHLNHKGAIASEESDNENIEDIKLEKDLNYFSLNTDYIKYDPIKNYCSDKKIKKLLNLNKIEKLTPILEIPRIRPTNKEDAIKIREKLKNYNVMISENENKDKEKIYYKGSFPLIDEKHSIEIYVPCYDDKFIFQNQKIFPKLKKFDEDNDTLTDTEQLDLEIKRGNDCLLKFLKKVKEEKDYIQENISRNNITKHDIGDDENDLESEDKNENNKVKIKYKEEDEIIIDE